MLVVTWHIEEELLLIPPNHTRKQRRPNSNTEFVCFLTQCGEIGSPPILPSDLQHSLKAIINVKRKKIRTEQKESKMVERGRWGGGGEELEKISPSTPSQLLQQGRENNKNTLSNGRR